MLMRKCENPKATIITRDPSSRLLLVATKLHCLFGRGSCRPIRSILGLESDHPTQKGIKIIRESQTYHNNKTFHLFLR
jgi:hypothetical protein